MKPKKPYLFISHSSKDNEFTRQLAHDLREAGFQVWLDVDSIPDGSIWPREIQKAVEKCEWIVVVMSAAARESEWVERETLLAQELRKPLYIALKEAVPLPLHLINRQFTDFRGGYAAGLAELIAALRGGEIETPAETLSPYANEENFFSYIEQMPDGEEMALVARDLYQWAKQEADSVIFSGKHTPGFHGRLKLNENDVIVFSVWAYLRRPAAQIPLDYLLNYPPYTESAMRRSTLRSLNRLLPPDEQLMEDRADRRPNLPLRKAFDTAEKLEEFKSILAEVMDNLRSD